jgi:hypothetical protein
MDREQEGVSHDEREQPVGRPDQQLDVGHRDEARRTSCIPGRAQDHYAAFRAESQIVSRSPVRVVAVSREPERAALLDTLLVDANDYDVIVLECSHTVTRASHKWRLI